MSGWAAFAQVVSDLINIKQADRAMDRQEWMSRHAYRNAAFDLEAAGLNRVLALGSPAAGITPQVAPMRNPAESYYSAKQVAANVEVAKEQAKTLETQQASNEANAAKARAETLATVELLPFQKQQLASQSNAADANAMSATASAGLTSANEVLARLTADKEAVVKSLYTEFGPMIIELVKSARDWISSAKDAGPAESFNRAVDHLFGNDSGKAGSAKVSVKDLENTAISVIQGIETKKMDVSVIRKLSPQLREVILDYRPEWRKELVK